MNRKKRKSRKRNPKKRPQRSLSVVTKRPQSKALQCGTFRYLKSGWQWIVGLSALATLAGFAFVVYPRLTVSPGQTILPSNPFYTPFTLTNGGYLPIENIDFVCGLREVTLKDSTNPDIANIGMSIANTSIAKLSASETTSIEFDRIFSKGTPIASADIEVMVTYKPFLLPIRMEYSQRFKTRLNHLQELQWIPVAKSK